MNKKVVIVGLPSDNTIINTLTNSGFKIKMLSEIADCSLITGHHPDLVLLTHNTQNKVSLIQEIKRYDSDVAIINIFEKYDEIDIIVSLETGGDDFVMEPINPRVFLAKIKALLRRLSLSTPQTIEVEGSHQIIRLGDIIIYPDLYKVIRNGESIELRLKEFKLLCFFAKNRGKILSRTDIVKEVGIRVTADDSRIVDVYVNKLRNKLNIKNQLKTYKSIGYMLENDE